MTFDLDSYVDVAERIRVFYEKYPEGRLTSNMPPYVLTAAGKDFVVVNARAYRTPDDPLPGDGWAWEPVPGPTQFTRDSELMNAQTAAWGRAIVALGFETKKIASAQEVRNRQGTYTPEQRNAPYVPIPSGDPDDPGSAVLFFGKHKDQTIQQVWDESTDEDRRNGKTYVNWLAYKSEPKTAGAEALQAAAIRFLTELENEGMPPEWAAIDDEAAGIPFN